jgi:Tfp pilus assembly protein PilF
MLAVPSVHLSVKLRAVRVLLGTAIGAGAVLLVCGTAMSTVSGANPTSAASRQTTNILLDYPLNGSVFPPEITPPTFLWRDANPAAAHWVIEISFANKASRLRVDAAGEPFQSGKIDPDAGPEVVLTPEQAATRTWRPDAATWAKIKQSSVDAPATIAITGYATGDSSSPVSAVRISISTSIDPVGAPIFYRDVPLLVTPPGEKGPIQPLPRAAIPLIKWQIRNIGDPQSRVVMEKLHTCANCHSFSGDGKTLGLDLDGPRNDKGLYALAAVSRDMAIANKDVIRWSSFQVDPANRSSAPNVKRFGFMSQVSPDGRYVVTNIGPPAAGNAHGKEIPGFASGLLDRLYSTNYKDYRFLQVFYPTRGILAWYDRKDQQMRPLPGADDPAYVQTSAFWSPDGKYLVFSRAAARDPYPAGAPRPEFANDPREPQIQYDLYKIPFNQGRGGKAVPVRGASSNGMSNNFPKVSPDGRWIVFVQNKNGLLMRPDSRLYIVPFEGGQARLMNCNTSLMNSWHTFSPNGHWLAFSSKARTPYTRLMLTHIDAHGNDSPAIIVDNTTAANRAVNIPEFVNIAPDGLQAIDPQAMEFYKLVDDAFELSQSNRIPEAIAAMRQALDRNPDDAMAHYNLALLLTGSGQTALALDQYRKASALSPDDTTFLENLGVALMVDGDLNEATIPLQKAARLEPGSANFQFNLGYALEANGNFAEAIAPLDKAVSLSGGNNARFLSELAKACDKSGHSAEAVQSARKALDFAVKTHDAQGEEEMREILDRYEHSSSQTKPL